MERLTVPRWHASSDLDAVKHMIRPHAAVGQIEPTHSSKLKAPTAHVIAGAILRPPVQDHWCMKECSIHGLDEAETCSSAQRLPEGLTPEGGACRNEIELVFREGAMKISISSDKFNE